MFLSKYAVYKSGQMNKYRSTCTFSSKVMRCSKHCQKTVVLPEIAGVLVDRASRNPAAGFLVGIGRIVKGREHHSHPLRFNSEKHLLTCRLQKNTMETTTPDYADKSTPETTGRANSGYAAECPATVPKGDLASPPVTWR